MLTTTEDKRTLDVAEVEAVGSRLGAGGVEESLGGGVADVAAATDSDSAGEDLREGVVGVSRMGVAASTGGELESSPAECVEEEADTAFWIMAATSEGRRDIVGSGTEEGAVGFAFGTAVSGVKRGGGGVSTDADRDGAAPHEERSSASEWRSSITGSSITSTQKYKRLSWSFIIINMITVVLPLPATSSCWPCPSAAACCTTAAASSAANLADAPTSTSSPPDTSTSPSPSSTCETLALLLSGSPLSEVEVFLTWFL